VVTEINGGDPVNALPQHVIANVNCRILPGVPIAEVRKTIVSVLDDPKISVMPTARRSDRAIPARERRRRRSGAWFAD
jgi:acetylornithine deacetylase/succinyl-diaminopimelate desuccinylase-like protein